MKMLKSTLAVVTALAAFGVIGAANAGTTLDAIKRKVLSSAASAMACQGFPFPTPPARSPVSTLTSAAQ